MSAVIDQTHLSNCWRAARSYRLPPSTRAQPSGLSRAIRSESIPLPGIVFCRRWVPADCRLLSLSQAAGIDAVRFGGGSYVDENWHFNVNNPSVNPATIGDMAEYAAELGANAIVDVNYGTGSPEEAVALWAYLDGSPSDTTSIAGLFGNNAGDSEQWNTTTKAWVSESWNTVGYWASLREAVPSQRMTA